MSDPWLIFVDKTLSFPGIMY